MMAMITQERARNLLVFLLQTTVIFPIITDDAICPLTMLLFAPTWQTNF